MLEKEGFDAWAEEYDRSVRETDEASGYPFAGYDALMSWLRQEITAEGSRSCGQQELRELSGRRDRNRKACRRTV